MIEGFAKANAWINEDAARISPRTLQPLGALREDVFHVLDHMLVDRRLLHGLRLALHVHHTTGN